MYPPLICMTLQSPAFRSLPSSVYVENGFEYSIARVKMDFKRTDRSRSEIFSRYHGQTGTFSLLSLISFSINQDELAQC